MTFILSEKDTVHWPVKYKVPKDGGKFDAIEFMGEFKRLPQSRLDELMELARKTQVDDDHYVDEVLVGWSGIKQSLDVDGKKQLVDFEFSDANKCVLLDRYPGMRAAIVIAHQKMLAGVLEKN